METNNRRDFLKKAALAGASALVAPSLFAADGEGRGELSLKIKAGDLESKLIVPKNNGLKITGTFLDEISADIMYIFDICLIRTGVRKNGIWIFSI